MERNILSKLADGITATIEVVAVQTSSEGERKEYKGSRVGPFDADTFKKWVATLKADDLERAFSAWDYGDDLKAKQRVRPAVAVETYTVKVRDKAGNLVDKDLRTLPPAALIRGINSRLDDVDSGMARDLPAPFKCVRAWLVKEQKATEKNGRLVAK